VPARFGGREVARRLREYEGKRANRVLHDLNASAAVLAADALSTEAPSTSSSSCGARGIGLGSPKLRMSLPPPICWWARTTSGWRHGWESHQRPHVFWEPEPAASLRSHSPPVEIGKHD
jgi:hypothetical protein